LQSETDEGREGARFSSQKRIRKSHVGGGKSPETNVKQAEKKQREKGGFSSFQVRLAHEGTPERGEHANQKKVAGDGSEGECQVEH